jgi:hypothetical protein
MNSLKKMPNLAGRFERKLSLAQLSNIPRLPATAQPSELEVVLRTAGLRLEAEDISPYLDQANIPASAHFNIRLKVNPNQSVTFDVTPPHPALTGVLNRAYATKMQNALKAANVGPAQPMFINIATF